MRKKRQKRKLQKTLLLIVDGESEQIYLNSFKNQTIYIKPELPKKKSLSELYRYFKDEKNNYDKTFWIIDLDVPIRENRLNDIKEYIKQYQDEIIINHPCLEFWFLLHFKEKNFNSCKDIISHLKRNYQEFQTYNKSKKDIESIINKLQDRLEIAIKNSKKRECNLDELINNCSEMFKFFEYINSLH